MTEELTKSELDKSCSLVWSIPGMCILCTFLAVVVWLYLNSKSSEERIQEAVDKATAEYEESLYRSEAPDRAAYDMAEAAVLRRLDSPGTARFPDARSKDPDSYSQFIGTPRPYRVVKSWVDSEISLGSLTRKRFWVRLRPKANNGDPESPFESRWEVYEVELENWVEGNQ